ncbi:MAG: hypothetical protein J4F48_14850 [Nitrospinae bacterium]|nr:hypothetical protein [Nitrospinota bacterium]
MKPVVAMLIATAFGVVLTSQDYAFACAVCGVDSEPGFLWSMGFLISMPISYTIPGAQRESRRTKAYFLNKKEKAK